MIDLQIKRGQISALVSGSRLYTVDIKIKRLPAKRRAAIRNACGGEIASIVELLQGRLSKGEMAIMTDKTSSLFPAPQEISLSCSCPDWAVMCKHVAATLYGIGARLDEMPELLFTLRGVEPSGLVTAVIENGMSNRRPTRSRGLKANSDLSSIFGGEIEDDMAVGDGEGTGKRKLRTASAKNKRKKKQKTATKKGSVTKAVKKKVTVTRVTKRRIVKMKQARKRAE